MNVITELLAKHKINYNALLYARSLIAKSINTGFNGNEFICLAYKEYFEREKYPCCRQTQEEGKIALVLQSLNIYTGGGGFQNNLKRSNIRKSVSSLTHMANTQRLFVIDLLCVSHPESTVNPLTLHKGD